MKTRESLLAQTHLCKSENKLLFGVGKSVASAVFDVAHQTDLAQLGRPRMFYYGKKVSIEAVLAVTGKSFNMLAKQIKSSDSPAK